MPASSTVKSSTWWIIALIVTCVITIQIQLIVIFSLDSASEVDWTGSQNCHQMLSISFDENVTSIELFKRWSGHTGVKGHMLAVQRQDKGYMAVGVVVSGCRDSNSAVIKKLRQTIGQLVNYTSPRDKLNNVIVVAILSSVDSDLLENTLHLIIDEFSYSVRLGFIQVLQQPSKEKTEKIQDICSMGDRGVDIAAMAFVERYVLKIAQHYLHIGSSHEEVDVSPDFVDDVRGFVTRETRRRPRGPMWTLLEFGSANSDSFLGTFMRSADLAHFTTFFRDFQQTDFSNLYNLYLEIVSQRVRAIHYPPIFQQSGYSEDSDRSGRLIAKPWTNADDPAAAIMTSMTAVDPYVVQLVYASSGSYFRAKSPTAGDWITIVFDTEVEISSVRIQTGLPSGQYAAQGGLIEASPRLLKIDNKANNVVCADFVRLGVFGFGAAEFNDVSKMLWGRPTRCLQLTLTSADGGDVVFHQIAVFV